MLFGIIIGIIVGVISIKYLAKKEKDFDKVRTERDYWKAQADQAREGNQNRNWRGNIIVDNYGKHTTFRCPNCKQVVAKRADECQYCREHLNWNSIKDI